MEEEARLILDANRSWWSKALSLRPCSKKREMLELHLEKDLELNLALEVKPCWGCGPIFWKVIMDELEDGDEGKWCPNTSLSEAAKWMPWRVVWARRQVGGKGPRLELDFSDMVTKKAKTDILSSIFLLLIYVLKNCE